MGLAEKKIQAEFADKRIPDGIKSYAEATQGATKDIKVEIDWASFGDDKRAHESLWAIWEQPFQALQASCEDETGRAAVKKGVKKIVIKNVSADKAVATEFKGGVLTVSMNAGNGASGTPGHYEIQKVVESGL